MLKTRIFDPLHMASAGDCLPILPGDAIAYTRFALGPPRPSQREAAGWYFAAGELCMTPSDLAKWDIAFLEKKILSARSYEEFTREVLLANGDHTHYALDFRSRIQRHSEDRPTAAKSPASFRRITSFRRAMAP